MVSSIARVDARSLCISSQPRIGDVLCALFVGHPLGLQFRDHLMVRLIACIHISVPKPWAMRPKCCLILPQDGPYSFACCGCSMVHDLHASVDDDGEIALQVFNNDAETERLPALDQRTARRERRARREADAATTPICVILGDAQPKGLPMAPAPRNYIINDEKYLDENGLVKPGGKLRVPAEMRDSASPLLRFAPAPTRSSEPMIIETGLRNTPYALDRFFYPDGTRKRRRTVERDPMGREAATFEEEDDVADAAVRAAFADQASAVQRVSGQRRQLRAESKRDSAVEENLTFDPEKMPALPGQ
jgi:hypothetical protein